jgi:hypothetical protein
MKPAKVTPESISNAGNKIDPALLVRICEVMWIESSNSTITKYETFPIVDGKIFAE